MGSPLSARRRSSTRGTAATALEGGARSRAGRSFRHGTSAGQAALAPNRHRFDEDRSGHGVGGRAGPARGPAAFGGRDRGRLDGTGHRGPVVTATDGIDAVSRIRRCIGLAPEGPPTTPKTSLPFPPKSASVHKVSRLRGGAVADADLAANRSGRRPHRQYFRTNIFERGNPARAEAVRDARPRRRPTGLIPSTPSAILAGIRGGFVAPSGFVGTRGE